MDKTPIATASSVFQSQAELDALCQSLADRLSSTPDLIIASYSSLSDVNGLMERLHHHFPTTSVMGGSTCRGSITADGLVGFGHSNVSLWGLCDDEGDYGVGYADYGESVAAAAECALEQALANAQREGELPDMVWLHSSPGNEEEVVATLDRLLGQDVSIIGGSVADEALEGKWSCFADQHSTGNGVALAVFFSGYEISTSFQSGYQPTQKTGVATRCQGRTVFEIDHQPAAERYNEWADSLVNLADARLPVNVLGSSTLSPLGIAVGEVSGIPYYNLVHPETYTEDRALTFFCEVAEGETLTLMNGSLDNIISRPGRVANEAIHTADGSDGEVLGGLAVFCGGCLLAVEPRVSEITQHLNANMQEKPYLGCFTFGEQGRFSGGENRHGNLMISVTVFKKR